MIKKTLEIEFYEKIDLSNELSLVSKLEIGEMRQNQCLIKAENT